MRAIGRVLAGLALAGTVAVPFAMNGEGGSLDAARLRTRHLRSGL